VVREMPGVGETLAPRTISAPNKFLRVYYSRVKEIYTA